jgi:hypothetical protein
MSTDTLVIPTPESLRAEIRARSEQLRAMRKLLRLADAAQAAGIVNENDKDVTNSDEQQAKRN